jgi:hypothetical protein
VDSAWEQEKLEARKMLENAAESHTSGARFVGRFCVAMGGVGIYSVGEQGDHAHEFVIAMYRTSSWSPAALFSERVGMNART